MEKRNLNVIAKEIASDWKKVSADAEPYLKAMLTLNTVEDSYYFESGSGVVCGFLANCSGWRGETAKRIKRELKDIVGLK